MRYRGTLYRALNPVYAREPLSGRGAALHGGRFNARGTPALYLSLDALVAIREANQVGSLQPTTLVAYEADVDPVFDCRDQTALASFGMTADDLAATTWREDMRTSGRSRTQALAVGLVEAGFSGLMVRSFARGSSDADLNIVLWTWGGDAPARLQVIDDEGRLVRS